jgi:smad nuclear-interacting protein 1
VEPDDTGKKGEEGDNEEEEETPRQQQFKPNFGLSGALSKDTQSGNVYKGVVLKFKEPPEARAPNTQWRFYVFKKGQKDAIETLHISKQSAYLMGRNIDIADIPMHHPSLSGQHAVLQYRALPSKANEGRLSCQPYIMDLESTNGTFVNGVKIDPARYYQLKRGDVLTFGASTREYVLLTENTTKT